MLFSRREIPEARRLTWPLGLVCLALPIAITCIAAAVAGVFPFGDAALVTWDEKYQYIDFFAWLKRVMAGEASLFYTLSEGLGSNAWGLFGYYLCSPFNLLLVFFDANHLEEFLFVATVAKLACGGAAMAFYLRRRFGVSAAATCVLSAGYACSAWTMSQFSNIMWLDAIVVLPLLLYGCYCFVANGSWKMMTLSAFAAVVVCWYTAYMLLIFAVLYTVFELYLRHVGGNPATVRSTLALALRYAGSMALALALSAAVFLPTVLAMLSSDEGLESKSLFTLIGEALARFGVTASTGEIAALLALAVVVAALVAAFLVCKRVPLAVRVVVAVLIAAAFVAITAKLMCYVTLGELLAGWLPFSYDLWRTPQFYVGIVPLALGIAFFANGRIAGKKRVALGVFLAVMLASCCNTMLYCVWCGMRVPGGFYCRIAFLAAIPLVFAAATAWRDLEQGRRRSRSLEFGFGFVALMALATGALGQVEWTVSAAIVAAAAVGYALLRLCFSRGKAGKVAGPASALLVLAVAVELALSGAVAWGETHQTSYSHANHAAYVLSASSAYDALAQADPGAYRVDKTFTRADASALSDGMAYGYAGLSSYTSAHSGRALALLNAIGYGDQDDFSTEYVSPVVLSDALLGVKYVSSAAEVVEGYERVDDASLEVAGAALWQNPYCLPIAYLVDDGAADTRLSAQRNPFEQQNALVSALLGEEVSAYYPVEATSETNADGSISYTLTAPANAYVYAYVQGEMASDYVDYLYLSTNSAAPHRDAYGFSHNIQAICDALPVESTCTAEMTVAGATEGGAQCLFYAIDKDTVAAITDRLREGAAEVSVFEDGRIEAEVTAQDAGYLMITVANDEGWTVSVNGTEVETRSAYEGALMLVPVEAGDNVVVATFTPAGLREGIAISVVALIAFVALVLLGFRRKRVAS